MMTPVARANHCPAVLAVILALASSACASAASWSSTIEPELQLEGYYQWLDAYDVDTGCRVEIFTQGQEYRGWVSWDPTQPRECPWYGYELYEFRVRGFEVRLTICSPRNCGTGARMRDYSFNVVPRVSLIGRQTGGSEDARWREITLIYLDEEPEAGNGS